MVQPVNFLVQWYENAHRPFSSSRAEEYGLASRVTERFGLTLTEEDFDMAISIKFGDDLEYEWPKP